MIKKIAWNTFKNTGNVDTFMELKQIQDIEAQMQMGIDAEGSQNLQMADAPKNMTQEIEQQMEEQNGFNQNEWYNNI